MLKSLLVTPPLVNVHPVMEALVGLAAATGVLVRAAVAIIPIASAPPATRETREDMETPIGSCRSPGTRSGSLRRQAHAGTAER